MALKQAVRERILNDVIRSVKSSEWKVLVVDQPSMRMISACCKMTEIMTEGITLVEDLNKRREPLPSLEAVYLIMPTNSSVKMLMNDFDNADKPIYKGAHVFFTEACHDELFNELSRSHCARFIKTLKEINIAFVPYESQVFSMDTPELSVIYFAESRKSVDSAGLERCAEQIATLCSTLGEYPLIRYHESMKRNFDFAHLVQQKLDAYKADDHSMGQGAGKDRSQLLIIDRGFDPISPLVHELTMQAMTYDLLQVDNDVCRYESSVEGGNVTKETLLDENDDVWCTLRHQHIATASQQVAEKLKSFAENKRVRTSAKPSLRDLSVLMKQAPQYQKELSRYSAHFSIAESCMTFFNGHVSKLCRVEQDLVMGSDAAGEKIKDHVKQLAPLLQDKSIVAIDKIRLILLYIIQKGGDTQENVVKLCQHAGLSDDDRMTIMNLQKLGVSIILEGGSKAQGQQQSYMASARGERNHAYDTSRWTPYIKDIMEEAIEGKLSEKKFPTLPGSSRAASISNAAVSARYGQWHKERGTRQPSLKSGPRLIVFIIGGVSYSELRCAYEVTNASKTWDVVIGSSHILTPTEFLNNLSELAMATS